MNSRALDRFAWRWCVAAVLLFALLTPRSALGRDKTDFPDLGANAAGEDETLYSCGKARGKVSVSFKPNVELAELVSWAMGFTCKNFVFSSRVGGRKATVTIIAPTKMTARQAYRVFLVALQSMNLTVVPKGNVLEIVEAPQAKTGPVPLYRKGTPASSDQIVRLVMRPEHISVADLQTGLDALKSKDGQVTALPNAGIVIVTDYGNHIAKMVTLAPEIDRPVARERLYVIKVHHVDPTDLAAKLGELLSAGSAGAGASASPRRTKGAKRRTKATSVPTNTPVFSADAAVPSKIIADEHTSSLFLLATEAAYRRAKAIVDRIDIEIEGDSEGQIHLYYLANGKAKDLATTLTSVISGAPPAAGGRKPQAPSARNTKAGGSSSLQGQVRIAHDVPTNSLIIVASARDFQALRRIIRRLDMPRRQVYIEALILDVSVDNSRETGVSFHVGKGLSNGSVLLGGLQQGDLKSAAPLKDSIASVTGLLGGAMGKPFPGAEELLGVSIPSFGILFRAFASSNNVNVLSSPHIMTMNNVEAEISVGENIPYKSSFSGTSSGQSGSDSPFVPIQSIQRENVALTLKVTPHVNASDVVQLEIDLKIKELGVPDLGGMGPSWGERTIMSTVVVHDQESIVIGGLMTDKIKYMERKVPILGDIPIIGQLFKSKEKVKTKSNLLVILTPYVLSDAMDSRRILQRKLRERREFVETFTNFDDMDYGADVDYRRKRGLVEEINQSVKRVEREAAVLRELDIKRVDLPDGPIEWKTEGISRKQ